MRAKKLVNQILTFSRHTEVDPKPIQLSAIVKETLKLLGASLPPGINVKSDIQSDALVMADATQMHQVVMNLCTNASHAMADAGGLLSVRLSEVVLEKTDISAGAKLDPGRFIELAVEDTGYGIPADVRDKVFNPFFTTKKRDEGTGMGLSVTHGIVKCFGGQIDFDSQPGKGTIFRVHLPLVTGEPVLESGQAYDLPKGSERILVVDDNRVQVDIIRQSLDKLGYHVVTHTSGQAALNWLESPSEAIDLVMISMALPGFSADIWVAKLDAAKADVPIMIITERASPTDLETLAAMGIKHTITKPIVIKELARRIRRILDEETKTN